MVSHTFSQNAGHYRLGQALRRVFRAGGGNGFSRNDCSDFDARSGGVGKFNDLGTRDASSCEMKRLSSGMVAQLAAQLAELSHVDFLRDLHRYGVAVIDTSAAGIAFLPIRVF